MTNYIDVDEVIEAYSKRNEAINQLIEQRNWIGEKLKLLGFDVDIIPQPAPKAKKGRPAGSKNKKKIVGIDALVTKSEYDLANVRALTAVAELGGYSAATVDALNGMEMRQSIDGEGV